MLGSFARYFGERAAKPSRYMEKDWNMETYSRGGFSAFMTPGTLTSCGSTLSEPVGRIHWAGADIATVFPGYMDGAVRSGEQAAAEVLCLL